jgi:NADH-quinone oxidoreductase subunit N
VTGLLPAQGAPTPLPIDTPNVEYSALLPILIPMVAALVLLLLGSLVRERLPRSTFATLTVLAGLGSLVSGWFQWDDVRTGPYLAVADAVVIDGFGMFFIVTIACAVVLGALVADAYLRREGMDGPEFYVLMLLSASGGMVMAIANDLIVLFLGLEILSIALYVLAGLQRARGASREAALKYFLLGSFSSAVFLYGIALVYGATGSTQFPEIARFLATNVLTESGVLLAGMALLLVGLGFKVAAVPFHSWTPDVYQGAPTPVTAFMAAAAKAAGFAGLLRLFFSTFATLRLDWRPVVWALAIVTVVVGSVMALVQSDVKRMLAYSSISHAGYVLMGLEASANIDGSGLGDTTQFNGIAGSLFYLLAYTFMVIGSFAIVTLVSRKGDVGHALENYRGLAARRPVLAFAFTVFLLAQAGIPFTTGFLAKFYVISAAVDAESYALALVGMLAAVVAAFFYLRVTVLMYAPAAEGEESGPRITVPRGVGIALVLTIGFTVAFGVLPSPIMRFAEDARFLF